MQPSKRSGASQADDYDQLPYPSLPYAITQPSHTAAVASLYGIDAPHVETARVLELGCASGGNIIPLALRFPEARFVGMDIGRRHIEEGRQRATELGLTNLELRHGDISDAPFAPAAFDFIICHGVFSWVPSEVQDAILRICRQSLASNGIAAISYNVLPGWRLRSAVRDICLRHVSPDDTPQQRVARVRTLLADISAASNEADPYGLLLQQEAQRIAHRPASYILGEFLVENNTPFHFDEFAARVRCAGLDYLCEADLDAAVPEILRPDLQAKLRHHAGDDHDAFERYIDLFTGRTFRTSLLVQANALRGRERNHGALRALHFSANIRADASSSVAPTFLDTKGRAIRAKDPVVQHALDALAAAYPQTLPFRKLLEAPSPDGEDRLTAALSVLTSVGQVEVSTTSLETGSADDHTPRASTLARIEAAGGQPWVTGLHHRPVGAPHVLRHVLPLLTGAATRSELIEALQGALQRGELRPSDDDRRNLLDPTRLATHYLDSSLAYLAANAVLAPRAAD